MEADLEGDVGDAGGGTEEFFAGPVDASAGDVFGDRHFDDLFKSAAEVAFAEAGGAGEFAEGNGFVEFSVDELASAGDRFGFATIEDNDELVGVVGELVGEGFEQENHAAISFGLDGFGFEISVVEEIFLGAVKAEVFEFGEGSFEIGFGGEALEDLTGFEVSDDAVSEFDGNGGGAHSGEASAGQGTIDFGLGDEFLVGGDALAAG